MLRVTFDLEDIHLQAERTVDNDWLVQVQDSFANLSHDCHLSDVQLAAVVAMAIQNDESFEGKEGIEKIAREATKDWPVQCIP